MAYGEEFYQKTAMMGRNFIGFQHMRMAAGARVRRFREEDQSKELIQVQLDYIKVLTKDEKRLLKDIVTLYEGSQLWAWCGNVKGLGPMACATFLSYINPYIANTGGKSKAYMGLIPNADLKAGAKAKFNPGARGRMYVVTTNVIRAQDPYYTGLYYQKKEYYGLPEHMGTFLESPNNCPDYIACMKKMQGAAVKRAERDKTKALAVKKPSCKAHIDNRAKRWLSGLLVSHATEIMRREEGLDTSAFKAHHGYIPVPPY
jgi:hypothetical protein